MSPWDQQTSDGADKGRTQTPHAGVQPEELEVARTAVHVADRLILYVVDALPSPPDSEELKTSYIRGTKGLSEEVERIVRITGSNLDYIGEWHSHPDEHSVEPSTNDQKLLNWIRAGIEKAGETGLMCIIGEGKQLGVYL